jgi:hypothetical protein
LTVSGRSQKGECEQFITQSGQIARFSFDRRDLFADQRPKPRLFTPERHPELGRLETSVCGMNGVAPERIAYLAATIRSGKCAHAAVELAVQAVIDAELECEAAPEDGYAEHGVIVGWEDGDDAKSKRLSAMQELVAAVTAVRCFPQTPGQR